MNLSNQIREWLDEDGLYATGVSYLIQSGSSPRTFQHYVGKSYVPPNVMIRLRRQLVNYIIANPPQEIQVELEKEEPAKIVNVRPQEPDEVAELRNRAKPIHKRHEYLKAQLVLMSDQEDKYTDKERFDIAYEIMLKLIPELDRIYEDIREYEENDKIPGLVIRNDIAKEVVRMMKTIQYNAQRISRLKGLIKKAGTSRFDIEKHKLEIAEKESETLAIKTELGI